MLENTWEIHGTSLEMNGKICMESVCKCKEAARKIHENTGKNQKQILAEFNTNKQEKPNKI